MVSTTILVSNQMKWYSGSSSWNLPISFVSFRQESQKILRRFIISPFVVLCFPPQSKTCRRRWWWNRVPDQVEFSFRPAVQDDERVWRKSRKRNWGSWETIPARLLSLKNETSNGGKSSDYAAATVFRRCGDMSPERRDIVLSCLIFAPPPPSKSRRTQERHWECPQLAA